MISVDGNRTVLPVKLKLQSIALIKILKKKFFKRPNEFTWDKSPH